MTLKRFITEGESLPFFFGHCRFCFERPNTREVAIIPLCWIIRFWYWTLWKYKPNEFEKQLIQAQKSGYDEGYKNAMSIIRAPDLIVFGK